MSQNPSLPEESTEEIKVSRPSRARKKAESAASEEKKPARRTRKTKAAKAAENAEEEGHIVHLGSAVVLDDMLPPAAFTEVAEEEEAPRPKRTRKARPAKAEKTDTAEAASEDAPESAKAAEAPKPRAKRTRKAKAEAAPEMQEAALSASATADAPADAEDEGYIVRLGSAIVLDDMLPPAAFMEVTEEGDAPAPRTRNARKGRKAAQDSSKDAEAPKPRAKNGRKPREDAPAEDAPAKAPEAPAIADAVPAARENAPAEAEDEGYVVHLGSAIILDDMPSPSAVISDTAEDIRNERRQSRRAEKRTSRPAPQKAEPGNTAVEKPAPVDDGIGNRAPAAPALPEWFDDGVVTNILPFPGEFLGDPRSQRRGRKNRRNRDAQPLFNGSPYLPAPYQQEFYGQPQALLGEAPFPGRKGKNGRKNRRNAVPAIPADFDFNAAMLSDSVLGVALAPREEEFLPEDDGPQPVLSDQPVALPMGGGELKEDELAALDAAVNGNRIESPAPQKDPRKDSRKGKKAQKEDKAPREERKAAKAEAAEAENASKARRVLYISVVPDEQAEVVITEDGQVTEYFVEMAHQVKIRGNIYKGVINNIDTNLQAAFVNFGSGKNGFLQIDEVHPEYYLVPHDASHGPKYPPIQKVLKVGQEVLVQVVKEPAGTKGAFLTTWISIAGRFLVLTPGQEQIGVSRKVEDPEERSRLKDLLNGIQPGENMGVIIRTASEGASKASIQQDLQYLKKLWKDIQKKAPSEKTPSLIYQEADLAARSVRDYLSEDIVEIWTDDEATKARVEEQAALLFPDRAGDIVKLHKEHRQTLWERFGLLKQLESVTSREVVLPSGGRLVFDQTEALMAIDINSGKTQGKTNFEAMVFRTNMEAAEAIARHLRLRDIGGQVVIDFIEMRDKSHCREVERTLRNAMRKDRARHDVGHMSSFGLLELVRQRTGTSAISISCEPCPHCHGTGVRRNMEWQSLQALRDLQSKLCKTLDSGKGKKHEQKAGENATFIYETDTELALYMLNRKRDRIAALEEKFGVHIEIRLK